MKYRRRPEEVEAITFDDLIAYGIASGTDLVNGMPRSFEYKGYPVIYETDDCYLILIPALEETVRFMLGDMLITNAKGEVYPCKKDFFEKTYEKVE